MTDSRPDRRSRARLGWVAAVLALAAVGIVLGVRGIGGDAPLRPSTGQPSPTGSVGTQPSGTATADLPVGLTFGDRLFHASTAEVGRAMSDVVALHMRWIRVDMSWADLQPRSADNFDWSPMDAIVDAARAHHLSVLGLLSYTPPWARASGCDTFVCPPRRSAQFAAFARAVVSRYAPRGVTSYQIWNEPNIDEFWTNPNPSTYREVLRAAVPAMRAADGSVQVLLGGLAYTATGAGGYSPADFLRAACAHDACPVSAVSYDPYTYPALPSSRRTPLNAWQLMANPGAGAQELTAALAAVGLAHAKIWVTGFGAPTGSSTHEVDGDRQAAILVNGLHLARSMPAVVGGFFVDTWRDDRGSSIRDHFGIEDSDGTHKPAFAALSQALR